MTKTKQFKLTKAEEEMVRAHRKRRREEAQYRTLVAKRAAKNGDAGECICFAGSDCRYCAPDLYEN